MNYTLELDAINETIKVKASCLLSQDLRKAILLAIASQLGMTGYGRVIIDLTEATFNPEQPMIGALELTTFMRSIGIKPQVKLAFLYADAEAHRKYFETVAQSEGFNLRYFKMLDEATKWLSHP